MVITQGISHLDSFQYGVGGGGGLKPGKYEQPDNQKGCSWVNFKKEEFYGTSPRMNNYEINI